VSASPDRCELARTATLTYYKEFRNDNGTITAPPVAKSCFDQVRWTKNHCSYGNRGSEWDWMNFYWRLDNKDSYTFLDFTNVYQTACAGSCTGVDVRWSALQAAAAAKFGAGSSKAAAWLNQGQNFRVNL